MSLEDRGAQHDKEHPDKYRAPHTHYHMKTLDYVMRPSADLGSGAIIIVLPPVAEAKGRFYSFVCRKADAVNHIHITDDDDSECWIADIVLDGKCDRVLLYSDGLCWHPLGAGKTGGWPGNETTPGPGTSNAPTTLEPTDVPTTSQ